MRFNNQKGQIAILLPIIILVAGLFLFNLPKRENPPQGETTCLVGEKPPQDAQPLTLPAINNFSEGNGPDGTKGSEGGPNPNLNKNYILVRAKVPIDKIDSSSGGYLLPQGGIGDKTNHFVRYQDKVINGTTFRIFYPNKWGESTLDHAFDSRYGGSTTELRFHQEGVLFFLRLKPDGQPETIAGIDRRSGASIPDLWLVDIYQEESRYQASLTGARGYTYEDFFKGQCDQTRVIKTAEYPSVTPGGNSDARQLQLRNFVIITRTENSVGFSAHCKPAIYLYPQEETDVNVKVKTKGELLYTKPLYPSTGWNVTAYPDGKIVYNGANYDYLYYESRIPDSLVEKPKKGFVVEYQKLPELFTDILPKLGLSAKQTFDFKDYWEKVLPSSPYYFVGILSENNINSFEPLAIEPKPATIIRVRLYFEALEKKISVKEPKIITPKKNGFTVVEWGGMVKRDKDHPFTCSE